MTPNPDTPLKPSMTPSTELVSRLRGYAPFFYLGKPLTPKVCEEAADTITSLEARIAELEGFVQWCLSDKFDSRDLGIRARAVDRPNSVEGDVSQ